MDKGLPVESVIEMMVDRKIRGPSTLPQLLTDLARKMLDDEDINLKMSRWCIYNEAKQFYKSALCCPANLRKNLVITFHGEEGVDVGALRIDFFTATLRGIRGELLKVEKNVFSQEATGDLKMLSRSQEQP